ncbi:MAG TPA: GNAT family N-acetyltransferase [Pyrinomonadaceae bacterium]|nr:GNAT family N-acetyltransferase [Pyrinomonadaceae bacterium]
MRIEIRRANPEEADTLTEIAHAAKRHWKYPESWIEQWRTDLTISGEFIRTQEVFAATINGAVVGCCALVMTDSLAEIEHMWIRPEQMGSGVGRALFEYVRARAVERGARGIELSADPYAEGFYARMGAKRIGEIPANMNGESRVLPRMRINLD